MQRRTFTVECDAGYGHWLLHLQSKFKDGAFEVIETTPQPLAVGDFVFDALCRAVDEFFPDVPSVPGTILAIDGDQAWVHWNRPDGARTNVRLSDLTRA